ncbi:POTRA domain-containing protein [Rhizobium sp. RCAM05973]|uniref:POTRA domain-containing protein n=1 Tax=Rhizobium sp. RCAM05973 TaxID=2994066 RepID=UPI0022EBC0D5|nr:POTRA domain-containing protein [Rhizobium sp. RCAM05973]
MVDVRRPCPRADGIADHPAVLSAIAAKAGAGFAITEGGGPSVPKGAEKLSVRLKGVSVEGGLPQLKQKTDAITARLVGKPVTAAALFAAAHDLEQDYNAAGYGLVRVVLPAQKVVDGATLRLVVIDGFIERIDSAKLPANIRDRVVGILAPLVGRRGLSNGELERKVLLAGDQPGTVLRTTLSKGATTGGSVLTVEARYKPVTGSVSEDNTLSRALGHYSTTLGIDLNSPTGHGELVYLRASGAPYLGGDADFFAGEPRNRSLAAGITLPIGYDGMTFNAEVTDARTTPLAEDGSPGTTSHFTRYSARLRYPLIRGRDLTLNLQGGFDAQQEALRTVGPDAAAVSLDRLRIVRLGGDLSWYAPHDALVQAGLTTSFGIDGLGARQAPDSDTSDVPLSRQGRARTFRSSQCRRSTISRSPSIWPSI